MNTALAIKPDFWAPLRLLQQWLWPEASMSLRHQPAVPAAKPKTAPYLVAARAMPTPKKAPNSLKSKPLRVVRVVESGQARSEVGRMVISGRMADVCAELDRLAACEAA